MKNYEINEDTLAVIALENGKSKIIERNCEYYVDQTAYEVMDYSCQYFGSSYKGRVVGAKNILNANYKLPIIVEETRNLIFFPTSSPELNDCIWISLNGIDFLEQDGGETKIYFKNGDLISVDLSKLSIENQILRATRLEYLLRRRKNAKKED